MGNKATVSLLGLCVLWRSEGLLSNDLVETSPGAPASQCSEIPDPNGRGEAIAMAEALRVCPAARPGVRPRICVGLVGLESPRHHAFRALEGEDVFTRGFQVVLLAL